MSSNYREAINQASHFQNDGHAYGRDLLIYIFQLANNVTVTSPATC